MQTLGLEDKEHGRVRLITTIAPPLIMLNRNSGAFHLLICRMRNRPCNECRPNA